MKKTILALTLLTASATAIADRWLMTTPELLVSAGGSIGELHKSVSIKFTTQETLCYSATNFCLNPSVMWLFTENADETDDINDGINIGGGLDIKYKHPRGKNNGVYVEAGPVAFVKKLQTDNTLKGTEANARINLHAGAGIEYRRFTLSIDAYGSASPLYMLNVGYRL